jgi:RND family efflux transporter, MFP subunit
MKLPAQKKFQTVLLTLLVVAGCGINMPKETHTSFETITIKKQEVDFPSRYNATLEGVNEVTVTSYVSGTATEVNVDIGDHVRKGDILARIDDRQALVAVESAQANLLAAQASQNTAKLEMESNRNLFEKGIVSSYMLETATNAYNQATSGVAQAEADLKYAKLQLGFCTITSPITGVVGSRPLSQGEQVAPGTVVTKVSEYSRIKAKFSISENEYLMLLENLGGKSMKEFLIGLPEVSLELKNGTVYKEKGRIVRVSNVVDPITGAMRAEAEFPNPDGILASGNMGTVIIPFTYADQMVIPASAIVRQLDRTIVWKVGADSLARSTQVKVFDMGTSMCIMEGLQPGDVIVANGATNIVDGEKVIF